MQEFALEKFLNSNYSSPTYIPALDSYLYGSLNRKRLPNKVNFVLRTVDSAGNPVAYTLDDSNWTIAGLILTVNPSSITSNLSKIVGRTQTMTAWLEEHWGEELDTISFQGSTAAFIWQGPTIKDFAGQTGVIETLSSDKNGLADTRRRETLSYQEFKKIISLMNANAATFDIRGLVKDRLFIELSYNHACHRGYIENIDVTEDSISPFRFQYIMTFKVEKSIYYFSGKASVLNQISTPIQKNNIFYKSRSSESNAGLEI